MITSIIDLSAQQLRQAAALKERIDELQNELASILSSIGATNGIQRTRKGIREFSAAGLARIRAAQKARWAKFKGVAQGRRPRRKMSAAAKARLSAIAKARWKKAKATGKAAL